MPVLMPSSNGFGVSTNSLETQKKLNYMGDPLLTSKASSSTSNKTIMTETDRNHHSALCSNGIGFLDTADRRRISSSSNGVTENGNHSYDSNTTNGISGNGNHLSKEHSYSNGGGSASQTNGHVNSTSCREICHTLAYDIVFTKSVKDDNSTSGWLWKLTKNDNKEGNEYIRTMRKTVAEISERHEILFTSMVKKLNINRENFEEVFISVVDDIFSDGQINWGRIVTVYALGGKISQFFRDNGMEDCSQALAERIGTYVYEALGRWIQDNGSWDAFCQFFPETTRTEDKVWNGLMLTAVGLAGAAGLATLFMKS